MFTGLVEATAAVAGATPSSMGFRLELEAVAFADSMRIGDSLALNGCCLTVSAIVQGRLSFDLLRETMERTNLHSVRAGSMVNLERALAADGRLGGHFVTGHIDSSGVIRGWGAVGHDYELRVGIGPGDDRYLVPKGCIAVDGISLTVANVGREEFSVWIIPHTREVTALRERVVGDRVNLEFDLLAKYAEKILADRR